MVRDRKGTKLAAPADCPLPTWLAHTRVGLPLVLAYTVGWTRIGVTRVGHNTPCLHVHSAAGLD